MFHRDTVKYITVFIDDQLAVWNWRERTGQALPIYDGPRWEEIRNASIPTNKLTWQQVAKKYGTCLGVVVELWTTKSGDWQPGPRPSSDH